MELRKKVAIGLGVAAVASVIFCVCVQAGADEQAPKISYGEELTVVTDSTTREMLLADVKAEDNKDGDVSSKVIVGEETIEGDTVEIVYIVADSAGNVASKTRVVPYEGKEPLLEEPESVQEEETEEIPEEETTEAVTEAESTETVPEETADPAIPVIVLNQSSVTLPVGGRFVYSTYIASVSDDVDTREELFRNMVITGHYDVNTPGSYPLEFWLVDKDGNQSARQPFTLIIE